MAQFQHKVRHGTAELVDGGEVIVVAVHPRTCVGLVTLTSTEVELGAPVVMRRGY